MTAPLVREKNDEIRSNLIERLYATTKATPQDDELDPKTIEILGKLMDSQDKLNIAASRAKTEETRAASDTDYKMMLATALKSSGVFTKPVEGESKENSLPDTIAIPELVPDELSEDLISETYAEFMSRIDEKSESHTE